MQQGQSVCGQPSHQTDIVPLLDECDKYDKNNMAATWSLPYGVPAGKLRFYRNGDLIKEVELSVAHHPEDYDRGDFMVAQEDLPSCQTFRYTAQLILQYQDKQPPYNWQTRVGPHSAPCIINVENCPCHDCSYPIPCEMDATISIYDGEYTNAHKVNWDRTCWWYAPSLPSCDSSNVGQHLARADSLYWYDYDVGWVLDSTLWECEDTGWSADDYQALTGQLDPCDPRGSYSSLDWSGTIDY